MDLTTLPAPRFLYKFASSAYAPLDKDIVREMWVSGDLKDRLGIRHRKASKNTRVSDLETAPMFREPHARSTSELTLTHTYEPTRVATESDSEKRRGGYAYGNDSLDGDVERTVQPPLITVGSSPSSSSEMADVKNAGLTVSMSPHTSYYSSNDIPAPSPIPPSVYRFSNGEIGERSVRGSTASPEMGYGRPPVSVPSEAFEMQVWQSQTPSGSQGSRRQPYVPTYPSEEGLHAHATFPVAVDEGSRPTSWIGGRAL